LDDQERKLRGEYTDDVFDISSDMVVYENYVESGVGKYGRSLKSSVNLDKVGLNRKSKLGVSRSRVGSL